MYHMFNLYRGLPFPSPVLVSETALGFWHATLSRPEGGIHGFTGHLNKAAGPSIWSVNVHHVVRRVGSRAVEAMAILLGGGSPYSTYLSPVSPFSSDPDLQSISCPTPFHP
jgi:hypothetical protein